MEFEDDFELRAYSDEAPAPVHEKKLKRLKKGVRVSPDPLPDLPESRAELDLEVSDEQLNSRIESEGLGNEGEMKPGLNSDYDNGSDLEMDSGFDDLRDEVEEVLGFDDVGDASGARKALDFESVGEDFAERGEEKSKEILEESRDIAMEEPEKKKKSSDGGDEQEEEKKKSKRARSGDDTKSKDKAVKSKRRIEKERQEHLKELHAETQRLLRETREAAFKPVPVVQKPISSILEKIRRRKLEVFKKSMSMNSSCDDNGYSGRNMEEFSSEGAQADVTKGSEVLKAATEEPFACQTQKGSGPNVVPMDASNDHTDHASKENVSSQMDVDEVSKEAFRAPIDDTQDLFSDSQTTDSKYDNDTPSSPLEEAFAPSKLAMDLKLKLDSAPLDDISSDEEDNEKENVVPHIRGLASSSPIYDPVKAFVDDEAEEEDDGDHDQFLFPDKEDDEADNDIEDLQDMIASGYEEKPIDGERRNELHQKWLEQQDASGTEKIMQKLMGGSKLKDTMSFEKFGDEEDEQDSDDEATDILGNNSDSGSPKKVSAQMNLKIAKQMICQMFTDNDVYVSSEDDDEEESEKIPAKLCSFKKTAEQATFLSPAEDENCSEVFGCIKKMNVVAETKKGKMAAVSRMQLKGQNGSKPKSSFIRESNQSVPASYKRGLSTARCSFIFGRDDSNSNSISTISVSEDSSDMFQRETTSVRTTAKLTSSQMRNRKEKSTPEAGVVKADASFFEILRQNSLHSKRCNKDTVIEETIQTVSFDQAIDAESVGQTIQNKRRDPDVDRTIQSAFASFRVGRAQSKQRRT